MNEVAIDKEKKKQELAIMSLIVTIVSFLGFCTENIFISLRHGFMNNRNMILPFLLGYGLAIIAIYYIFGTPQEPRFFKLRLEGKNKVLNWLTFYAIAFVCVSVGEIVLGTFVEKTCGIVWWDYSSIPLNITKYTSVPTSLGLALLITVFMGCFFQPLYRAISKINKKALYPLAAVCSVLLVADFLFCGIRMFKTRNLLRIWKIKF